MDDLFKSPDTDPVDPDQNRTPGGSDPPDSSGQNLDVDPFGSAIPLATRMRPQTLDDYAGQRHILGEGKLLRRAVEADRFNSLIFYGPPGVGKTTLARVIAGRTKSRFVNLSGVESNVAEMRKVADAAASLLRLQKRTTILFVDEIHRFNKAQQDVLLPHIERGTVRFIGATTHNPFFYINSPLVSRSQVFQLEPLDTQDLEDLVDRALTDTENGLGSLKIRIDSDARTHLATSSDGDARKCLTALELAAMTTDPGPDGALHIDIEVAAESIQHKTIVYDGDGDAHYDTISAFIKSMRGCDPDATLYWLAKMLYAGEDPRFIARRIVIAASEDVGMADSNALRVAMAAQQAFEFLGMPEGRIPLAHAAVYIATAPKSNRTYAGLNAAAKDISEGRTLAVPPHLRTKSRKKLAAGSGTTDAELVYKYGHDHEGGFVPQAYLPDDRRYYDPTENGLEARVKERLDHWRAQFESEKSRTQNP